ncbi:MAG: hypothetical protein EAZ08_13230 [Cytophagales bacterium]|nr:MAG: hypothetical protein EAZ08_13230 [Cytophagales bacterium]
MILKNVKKNEKRLLNYFLPLPPPKGEMYYLPLWRGQGEATQRCQWLKRSETLTSIIFSMELLQVVFQEATGRVCDH